MRAILFTIAITLATASGFSGRAEDAPPEHPALPSINPGATDPFAWLEDVHGARSMAWVAAQNARTEAHFEADPRYEAWREEAVTANTAPDRIPYPAFLGTNLTNLWADEAHPKGLWRTTTLSSFRTTEPVWVTLLDLDALSKAEGRHWVFMGADCLPPSDRLCLVKLSDGGGDAVEVREFDTAEKVFVPGGFRFSVGQQSIAWVDADTLLVARDWGPGTLSRGGAPLVVKQVRRGQPFDQAREVFQDPAATEVVPVVLRNPDGGVAHTLVERHMSFFRVQWIDADPNGAIRDLDLPRKAVLRGYVAGRLILSVNEDWRSPKGDGTAKAGTLIAYDPHTGATQTIFRPASNQSIDDVAVTGSRVLVSLLDNVDGAVEVISPGPSSWSTQRLAVPAHSGMTLISADTKSDTAYLTSEGFLEPPELWEVNAARGAATLVKRLPARFDASRDVVEQHFAVSSDGTRVPYFLVRPKGMKYDGATPTFMFGYGGFQISELPYYSTVAGKFWLERGGAYVQANIRGGGEFGPIWHEAGRRQNRQRVFDDFAAIARDLIAKKITSPRRLGIWGVSNGGILVSVSITQHPELFHAAVLVNPIIDMLDYTHLSTGAQWIDEYGDPDLPSDRAFIAQYSAYTLLRPGVSYPEPLIETNTADDRVHPAHARKFAAELEALGDPVLFFEATSGGHVGAPDPAVAARSTARRFVYLAQKLAD